MKLFRATIKVDELEGDVVIHATSLEYIREQLESYPDRTAVIEQAVDNEQGMSWKVLNVREL